MTGITMGTPHYMSPEQIKGSQNLDVRSDIYALGATAMHLITGQPPYQESSPGAVMTAHLTEPVPDPKRLVPSLHESTRTVIRTCMAKRPDERYKDCNALIKACEKALEDLNPENGGQGMRLLRKPLVLNKQSGRSGSDRLKKKRDSSPLSAETGDGSSAARLASARERIKGQTSSIHRKKTDVPAQPSAAPNFPELEEIAPVTPDLQSMATSATDRMRNMSAPASSTQANTSRSFSSNRDRMLSKTPIKPRQSALDQDLSSPGLGAGPMIALAVAAILVIAAFVWVMM